MDLARKISRAKWDSNLNNERGLAKGEISADAVTGDLRTQNNTLSFWQCNSSENSSIENAALAIAAAGNRLDRLDIVWLSDSELRNDGFALKRTDSRTPVTDLVKSHVDICNLDYVRLGNIANHVKVAVQNEQISRLSKNQVKRLLTLAVSQGRIALKDLSEEIRNEISGQGEQD